MTDDAARTVTMHSSWTGIVAVAVGAGLLDLLGLGALLTLGVSLGTVTLMLVALVCTVLVLLDLPVAAEFGADGVTRVSPARRSFLPWGRVTRLSRLRRGVLRTSRSSPVGGLVAMLGSRRVVLVDRMEGKAEFEQLVTVLGPRGADLLVDELAEPPLEQTPTWMYRRSKWAPDATSSTGGAPT